MPSPNQAHPQCDCKTHTWTAKINCLGAPVSATGQIRLSTDGITGWFQPDSELSVLQMSWIESGKPMSITVSSPQSHTHDLKMVQFSSGPEGVFRNDVGQHLKFEIQAQEPYPESPRQNEITDYDYAATLQDQDGQPLATGEAFLYPSSSKADFYPEKIYSTDLDSIPLLAARLKTSDGRYHSVEHHNMRCEDKHSKTCFHFHCRKLNR